MPEVHPTDAQGCPIDDFGRRLYPETCTPPSSVGLLSPALFSAIRTTLSPTVMAAVRDAISAQRVRAAAMPDAIFYGWDAGYSSVAELQDLRRQSQCGGGGCNDYFCNWQMWAVLGGLQCDIATFTGIMFQMERYVAAQERLKRLMANIPVTAPKTWWESVAGRAPGRLPNGSLQAMQIPDYSGAYSANAVAMADWCLEVLRTVSVAQWASNVRWSNPLWPSGGNVELLYHNPAVGSTLPVDPNDPTVQRALTAAELARGMGATVGTRAAPQGGGIAISGRGWDVDSDSWNGFARFGYVRGMSANGVFAPGAAALNVRQDMIPEADMLGRTPLFMRGPYAYLAEALGLRWATDSRGTPRGYARAYPPAIPVAKSEWEPMAMYGDEMPPWSRFFALPASPSTRDLLIAMFRGTRGTLRENITLHEHAARRWDLRLVQMSGGGYAAFPGPTRHVVLCMQLANDIIGRNWGAMMSDAFGDYVNAVSQLPPTMRTLSPDQMAQVNRAMTQANLDTFASVTEGVGAATVAVASAISPIAGAVVGAVYAILSTLIRTALDSGMLRTTNPACLPSPVLRALPEPAEGNACWLVPDQTGQRGGSAAIVERATAIRDTAGGVDDISEMAEVFRATEEAARREIGNRGGVQPPGPPEQPAGAPTAAKVAAAAGGVAAGALLIRLLIGG